MSYYVVGSFDGRSSKCKSLSEARRLVNEMNEAIQKIEIAHPFGDKPSTCLLPIEIFTEDQWHNARRCD